MKRLGGFITRNVVAPTSVLAKGVWTLREALQAKAAGAWPAYVPVVPGSTDFDTPGADSYVVPAYNTLQIELWGGGGATDTCRNNGGTFQRQAATAGSASTIAALSLSAGAGSNGGVAISSLNSGGNNPGVGGTATGGDTNTSGNNGTAWDTSTPIGGAGGTAPGSGGAGGAQTSDANTSTIVSVSGNNGTQPGGGASGGSNTSASLKGAGAGGGSGAKCVKTYTLGDPGAPVPGDVISMVVGAGGVKNATDYSTATLGLNGANGGNGRIRFTVA